MLTLGVETSGLGGSLALTRGPSELGSRDLSATGRRHAQSLWVELQALLDECSLNSRQIEAIAVSRGPGSFTGLRVGMVFAKTFAYATGCRFIAVDTFAVVAANVSQTNDLWVTEDAQRGELFVARYQRNSTGDWFPAGPIAIVPGESWIAARHPTETVTGRGLARLDTSHASCQCLRHPEVCVPSAFHVARRGAELLNQGTSSPVAEFDFWKANPVYIRRSAAEERRDPQPT